MKLVRNNQIPVLLGAWEVRLLEWFQRYQNRVLLLALLGLALLLRLRLYPFASPQFLRLQAWLDAPTAPALADLLPTFPPLYLALLSALDTLLRRAPDPLAARLLLVKLIPLVFEIICAGYLYRLVRLHYPRGPAPLLAALGFGFAPTVVMNGAFLGQPGILAVTGLVACLYYLLSGHPGRAWLAFSLAVAFQPQSLFLLPVLLTWAPGGDLPHQRRLAWLGPLLVLAVYLAALVPLAWLAAGQVSFSALAAYPLSGLLLPVHPALSIYAWAPAEISDIFALPGLTFDLLALVLLTLAASEAKPARTPAQARTRLVLLSVISLLTGLYLFPGTRAAGFLPVDVLSIVLALYLPRLFYVPFAMAFISTQASLAELFNQKIIPLLYLAFIPLGLILVLAHQYLTHQQSPQKLAHPDGDENVARGQSQPAGVGGEESDK